MARKKLSALAIPTLPLATGLTPSSPASSLRIGTNRKTWTYRYRAGGRKLRLTLGHSPIDPAEAREAARKAVERVDAA